MDLHPLQKKIETHLEKIYYEDAHSLLVSKQLFHQLISKLDKNNFASHPPLSEETIYLITYGDSIVESKQKPLSTLHTFSKKYLKTIISDIHLLPMFPYTSDDGFSVLDYEKINPDLGDWTDINALENDFHLMFDFVANHMSKSSSWFQAFLNKEAEYRYTFIEKDPLFDTSNVVRPRTSPLFHEYTNEKNDTISAWTTFSEDQVDLNVKDPKTLVRLTSILLSYAQKGARSIRLDAIGFLWKSSGTTCMHLPETHEIIKLWRAIIDYYSPNTQIITETNVPHEENISYFGNTKDEATQVYQFPLPPLVLHAFTFCDATYLTNWAKQIHPVSDSATYFNFLSSHDGIGMRPVENILPKKDVLALADKVLANKGKISYKTNADHTKSIYELNINYGDALRNEDESEQMGAKKLIAAHHILFSLIGVPALYIHSLVGSHNDVSGMESSGIYRRINREQLTYSLLEKELQKNPYRKEIFTQLSNLISIRKKHSAFNPYADQKILETTNQVFSLRRTNHQTNETIDSHTNVSNQSQTILSVYGYNLLTDEKIEGQLVLPAYGTAWIKIGG